MIRIGDGTKPGRLTPVDWRTWMEAERRRRYRNNLLNRTGRRPFNKKHRLERSSAATVARRLGAVAAQSGNLHYVGAFLEASIIV